MCCKKCKCKVCSCIVNEQVKIAVNKIIQNPDEKGVVNIKVPTKTSELINDSGFGQGSRSEAKIENIRVNENLAPIVNKVAQIKVPTKTSDIINDSNFTTKTYVDTEVEKVKDINALGVLGSVLPTDDLANKLDGVYRATVNGDYNGIVAKEGYYTLLRKKDGVWSLESETEIPMQDLTPFNERLTQVESDVDNFIENFSVTIDDEFDINSNNPIANKTVTPISKVLDYFINPVVENKEENISIGYNENGVIVNNSEYRTITIDNSNSDLKELILSGARIDSTNPSNGYVVGIAQNGSVVNIVSASGNTNKIDVNFELLHDFSIYKKILVTFYITKQLFFEVISKRDINDESLYLDSVKKYVDKIGIVVDDFVHPIEYKNKVDIDFSTAVAGTLKNDNTNANPPSTRSKILFNINVPQRNLNINFQRAGELYVNVNLYPSILGLKANDTKVVLLPTSNISDNEQSKEFEVIIPEDVIKISICYSTYSPVSAFFYENESIGVPKKNSVTKYINNKFESISILPSERGVIDLYAKGLREDKTSVENTSIFNEAFIEAKSTRKNILIPPGIYHVDDIQVKGGVGFKGNDRNTILRSTKANAIFNYSATEAQSFIEANQLPNQVEYANQGVEIGNFILSGNGIGTSGLMLNNMAYSNFERIYMTGFTDVCMDMKGVLLCNFNDIQLTKSPNGIRSTKSDNGLFYSNLNNFTNCKFRYLSKIAFDWSYGAGINLIGCDLSAIGTSGDLTTGFFKLRNMSNENVGNGVKGIDLSIKNIWSEQLRGGFYLDISNCQGKTLLQDSSIYRSLVSGNLDVGVINNGSNVIIQNVQLSGLSIDTLNNGKTLVLNSNIGSHNETSGGTYNVVY